LRHALEHDQRHIDPVLCLAAPPWGEPDPAAISFRGHTYGGSSLRTHPSYTRSARIAVAHMHVIGTGVIPACRDTNHSTDQDRPVPVARIDGVGSGLAVATYPAGTVYVNALTSGVINKVLKSARGIRWR
jgi:hypothetical protein